MFTEIFISALALSNRLMSGVVCPPPSTQNHARTKLVDNVLVVTLDTPNAKVNGATFFFLSMLSSESGKYITVIYDGIGISFR